MYACCTSTSNVPWNMPNVTHCHTLQKPRVELKIYIKNWWENACSNIECELISQLNIGHKSPKKKPQFVMNADTTLIRKNICLWRETLPQIELKSFLISAVYIWNFVVFFPSNLLFEKRLFFRFVLLKFSLHADRSCLLCFNFKLGCP